MYVCVFWNSDEETENLECVEKIPVYASYKMKGKKL